MLNKILKAIIGLLLLSGVGILVLGIPQKTTEIITSVDIEAPVETVYEFVMDDSKMKEWVPTHKSTTKISGEEGQPGSKYEAIFVENGKEMKMIETITENTLNRKFAFDLEFPMFKSNHIDILFEENNDVTTVTEVNSYVGKGILNRAMIALARGGIRKSKENMYNALKVALED